MALRYKVVELSLVTDEAIEAVVNEWVAQGWQLEGIRFVTTEHSRRPAMAFVSFTCEAAHEVAPEVVDDAAPREPHLLVAEDNDVE